MRVQGLSVVNNSELDKKKDVNFTSKLMSLGNYNMYKDSLKPLNRHHILSEFSDIFDPSNKFFSEEESLKLLNSSGSVIMPRFVRLLSNKEYKSLSTARRRAYKIAGKTGDGAAAAEKSGLKEIYAKVIKSRMLYSYENALLRLVKQKAGIQSPKYLARQIDIGLSY